MSDGSSGHLHDEICFHFDRPMPESDCPRCGAGPDDLLFDATPPHPVIGGEDIDGDYWGALDSNELLGVSQRFASVSLAKARLREVARLGKDYGREGDLDVPPRERGFADSELEEGLVAFPLGEKVLSPGQIEWIEATPMRMMTGPYRLSVSGQDEEGLIVRDVRVGNECLFIGSGGVPARDFRLDPQKPWVRGLVPMMGPTSHMGTVVKVMVRNDSACTQTVSATLWGRTVSEDFELARHANHQRIRALRELARRNIGLGSVAHGFARQPPMEMRGVIPPTLAAAHAMKQLSTCSVSASMVVRENPKVPGSITLRRGDPMPSGESLGRVLGRAIPEVPTTMTTARAMVTLRNAEGRFELEPAPSKDPNGLEAHVARLVQIEWFGESWGAGICSEARRRLVPFGQCDLCQIDIEREDSGFIVPDGGVIGSHSRRVHYHRHCFHRLIGAGLNPDARAPAIIAAEGRLAAAREGRKADYQATLAATAPKPPLDEDPTAAWESASDEWP